MNKTEEKFEKVVENPYTQFRVAYFVIVVGMIITESLLHYLNIIDWRIAQLILLIWWGFWLYRMNKADEKVYWRRLK